MKHDCSDEYVDRIETNLNESRILNVKLLHQNDVLAKALRKLIYTTCSECEYYDTRASLENNMCEKDGCDIINKSQQALAESKEK